MRIKAERKNRTWTLETVCRSAGAGETDGSKGTSQAGGEILMTTVLTGDRIRFLKSSIRAERAVFGIACCNDHDRGRIGFCRRRFRTAVAGRFAVGLIP